MNNTRVIQLHPGNVPEAVKQFGEIPRSRQGQFHDVLIYIYKAGRSCFIWKEMRKTARTLIKSLNWLLFLPIDMQQWHPDLAHHTLNNILYYDRSWLRIIAKSYYSWNSFGDAFFVAFSLQRTRCFQTTTVSWSRLYAILRMEPADANKKSQHQKQSGVTQAATILNFESFVWVSFTCLLFVFVALGIRSGQQPLLQINIILPSII